MENKDVKKTQEAKNNVSENTNEKAEQDMYKEMKKRIRNEKRAARKSANKQVNWPVTVLLILGLSTVIFPLYMTVMIAFKQPSEMTNSIKGILSLPKTWSLSNFREAMEVTDFWNSLGNSLIITLATVAISILLHSMLGYVLGRMRAKNKGYKLVYFYIISGMFVPFAILMMPLVKQTSLIYCFLYADECVALLGISYEYSSCLRGGCLCRWCNDL